MKQRRIYIAVGGAAAAAVIATAVILLGPDDTPAPAATAATATTLPAVTTTTTSAPTTQPVGDAETPPTTEAVVVTTQPLDETPVGPEGCVGSSYRYQMMVRDACVVDAAYRLLTALIAGTHDERVAAVRDGEALRYTLEDAYTLGFEMFGEEEVQDLNNIASLWSDADARAYRTVEVYGGQWWTPISASFRWRFGLKDGSYTSPWFATWVTRMDGAWHVGYQSLCRFMPDCSTSSDPRPGVAAETGEATRPGYDANDDPNRLVVNQDFFPW